MFKSNRKKVVAAGIFAGLLVLSVFAVTNNAVAAGDKVTICHCTNGTPAFLILDVSANAWLDAGGNKHSPDHHQCFNDILGPTQDALAFPGATLADCEELGLP